MPYMRCPDCRITVYSAAAHSLVSDGCPVCGAALTGASLAPSVDPGSRHVCREILSTPGAVADARRIVDGLYADLGDELHGTTRLLVSELVTNAVQHSNMPHGVIHLAISVDPSLLRVEVRDEGEGFEAAAGRPSHPDGGFGLRLLNALSDRWNNRPMGDGGRVRFEIDRANVSTNGNGNIPRRSLQRPAAATV
jgi:serine/threonine-protein kinase RsbW